MRGPSANALVASNKAPSAPNPISDLFPPASASYITKDSERDGLALLNKLNRRHLERVLLTYLEHDNHERPQRALNLSPPTPTLLVSPEEIARPCGAKAAAT